MDFIREGIGNEVQGVDPVVHGQELDSVPGRGQDSGGYGMLFGPSSAQGNPVELSAGGQSQSPGLFGNRIVPPQSGPLATTKDHGQGQQAKEASSPGGSRPPKAEKTLLEHPASAALTQGPDVGAHGPNLLIRQVHPSPGEHG